MRCELKVLVTGGAGFIGSSLAKILMRAGHETVVVDDFSSASWENLVDFTGNVLTCDLSGNVEILQKQTAFDVIFHEASITDTTVMDQRKMMENNVEGFRKLLDLAIGWGSRVVWASSCSIYGQGAVPMMESQPPMPMNVYAYSKLAMERLAESAYPKLAQGIVGLRYANVYGPGEAHKGKFASMIHQLAKQMRGGKRPRIFKHGEQKRDFVYIGDIIQANLHAMSSKVSGVFNAGHGSACSFNEVVAQLNRVLKTDLKPDYIDNPFDFTQDCTQTDLSSARELLKYSPEYDITKGVNAYFESGKLGV